MARHASPVNLAAKIQSLLDERQSHTEALAHIEETLKHVTSALQGAGPVAVIRRLGRPPGSTSAATTPAAGGRKRRRRRGRFAVSAEESILAYVRGNKNPNTKDINAHWSSEGRGGKADNALTKLVKERRLKRTKIADGRGSTYAAL